MKKFLFFAAAAIAMLASCSQNDDISAPVVAENNDATPVQFGTYVGKGATSRATNGYVGDITDTQLKLAEASNGGFGVFAYYTKATDYVWGNPGVKPNFMYNQGIFWNSTTNKWEYTPVKYWPNGLDDLQPADGGDDDQFATAGGKVSFFAYAPYVSTPTGDQSSNDGIVGMTANTVTNSDTKISYKLNPSNFVDLLWGTANGSGNSLGGTTQAGATAPTVGKGAVNVNLTKQQIDGTVKFLFKHALAKVGGLGSASPALNGLQIALDIDDATHASSAAKDATTIVTVKSIRISTDTDADGTAENTVKSTGDLNLATGVWDNLGNNTSIDQSITTAGSNPAKKLNSAIAEPATVSDWASLPTGVTVAKQEVYDAEATNTALLYIPGDTPSLRFTIDYIVRTQDNHLDGGWSEVEQTVSKLVTFANPVEMNKLYNIVIYLGLTSVKFEATVADWSNDIDDNDATDDTVVVDLPLNVD